MKEMTKANLMKVLIEWLKESAMINDSVSTTWKEEDADSLNDYTYWMPNGVKECLDCSEEDAEYIRENDDFFEEAVSSALRS